MNRGSWGGDEQRGHEVLTNKQKIFGKIKNFLLSDHYFIYNQKIFGKSKNFLIVNKMVEW
jgi:hypothetical protein